MKSSESTSDNFVFYLKQIDFVWNITLLNEVI